jgi:hypothetical protein
VRKRTPVIRCLKVAYLVFKRRPGPMFKRTLVFVFKLKRSPVLMFEGANGLLWTIFRTLSAISNSILWYKFQINWLWYKTNDFRFRQSPRKCQQNRQISLFVIISAHRLRNSRRVTSLLVGRCQWFVGRERWTLFRRTLAGFRILGYKTYGRSPGLIAYLVQEFENRHGTHLSPAKTHVFALKMNSLSLVWNLRPVWSLTWQDPGLMFKKTLVSVFKGKRTPVWCLTPVWSL